MPTPSCPWPLLSKRECEHESPSQRQGISYEKELRQLRTVADLISKAGECGQAWSFSLGLCDAPKRSSPSLAATG